MDWSRLDGICEARAIVPRGFVRSFVSGPSRPDTHPQAPKRRAWEALTHTDRDTEAAYTRGAGVLYSAPPTHASHAVDWRRSRVTRDSSPGRSSPAATMTPQSQGRRRPRPHLPRYFRYAGPVYVYICMLRKGQLNRHTRYRPASTARNNTKHCHAAVVPLGGLTHR